MVNLNVLQLQNNKIVDLSPLDKLDDLTILNVKNNYICDLSVIYSKINRQKSILKTTLQMMNVRTAVKLPICSVNNKFQLQVYSVYHRIFNIFSNKTKQLKRITRNITISELTSKEIDSYSLYISLSRDGTNRLH
ncbi:Leucine-rich_repeat domain superfamily [Hexamita inflata]|nr:Leucine-rich repeat domain superfamily [Hexamita inflata]